MRPETIRFTGLELTPQQAIHPRKLLTGTYPAEWIRHQWLVGYDEPAQYASTASALGAWTAIMQSKPARELTGLPRLDRYIERKLMGRWGSYSVDSPDGTKYVVLFETTADAVFFRMLGGERAFLQPEDQW